MTNTDLLKVLIVDDEHLVRDLLKNCINWNEIGYQVVGEAANAHDALDLVEKIKPDVIFTDIYMPFMDGLEFGKIVFEKYPTTKIVVLTGYEEFEYAKRSIKIGIADFLLKPINDDEIRKTAIQLKEKIEAERDQQKEYDRIKKQLEDAIPYLKEKFLNQLVQGDIASDVHTKLEYFDIKIDTDHIQVATIETLLPSHGISSNHEEELLMLSLKSYELVTKYFRNDPYINVFRDNNQNIVIINSEKTLDLPECLETLRSLIINKFKCSVSIGAGNIYSGISKLRISYKEALYALNYKIIAGRNQVISYSEINFSSSNEIGFQNENYDNLAFYLKAGLDVKVSEYIKNALCECTQEKQLRIETIRAIASNIISVILSVMAEVDIKTGEVFHDSSQPFENIFKIDNLPEIKTYLLHIAYKTIDIINNTKVRKVNQMVEKVKEYILQNFSDPDISLSNTAKNFYMNMSYLSRIFKQETGYTFVEYLTKARMEKAVKLLKETNLKAYQIAEKVGITNPHYFGTCFKKWTGMSINDFRKTEAEKVK